MFFILANFFFIKSRQNAGEEQVNRAKIYGGTIRYEGTEYNTVGIAVLGKLTAGSKAIRYNKNRQVTIEYTKFDKILDRY